MLGRNGDDDQGGGHHYNSRILTSKGRCRFQDQMLSQDFPLHFADVEMLLLTIFDITIWYCRC